MYGGGEGIDAGRGEVDWVVNKDRFKYDEMFDKLNPIDGKISGAGKIYFYNFGLTSGSLMFSFCFSG